MMAGTKRVLFFLAGAALAALAAYLLFGLGAPAAPASGASTIASPQPRVFATIGDSASRIEGIAAHDGMLYVADWKDGGVYSVDAATGAVARVGQLPTKPGEVLLGVAADAAGNVYVGAPASGIIYRIRATRLGAPDFDAGRDADAFASGATGANGLAFDGNGHLWISGGDANAVYHVGPTGGPVQVFAQGYATESPDTTMPVRQYVTNGLGIDADGNVYTGNTGTGEITRLEVKPGYVPGAMTPVVSDPRLMGVDGIILDPAGDLWVSANFNNTLARISPAGAVSIVVHDSTASVLHFPAELKRIGDTFYLANLNFPVGANSATTYKGAQIVAIDVP